MGNKEKALELRIRAYAIDSTNVMILQQLGESYEDMRKWEEAMKYWKKFANGGGHPLETSIAYAYLKNGYKKEAENIFSNNYYVKNEEIINKKYSQTFDAYYFCYPALAGIYAIRGEKGKVYEYLNRSNKLKVFPNHRLLFLYSPIYDNLKDEPEFKKIVSEMEAKFQAEHERVREWLEENKML